MKKKILVIGFGMLIVSNMPPLSKVLDLLFDEHHYRYSNYSGSFTMVEASWKREINYQSVIKVFSLYQKKEKPAVIDAKLFRLFTRNPLAFWRWHSYFGNDPRYDLPYMNWKEIQKRRGANWKRNSSYQDF